MTGRRSHGRLSALNGVVHQGNIVATGSRGQTALVQVKAIAGSSW